MTAVPASWPVPERVALPDERHSDALGAALATMVREGFARPPDPASDAASDTADQGTTDAANGRPSGAAFDGFTIHFSGDLGSGKTTVVRALLRGLGVEGRIKSPTYTLVEPYVVSLPKSVESRLDASLYCYHFDFYRFEDPQEWLDAGFRDYFSDAVLRLVEWPERARSDDGSRLPLPDVHVVLETDGDGRRASLSGDTVRGATWLGRAPLGDLRRNPQADPHSGRSMPPGAGSSAAA